MHSRFGKWWPVCKALFGLAIVAAIGWRFARDLRRPELWQRSFHPGWLVLSGGLYLLGLGFSALFWYRLLRSLGQRPHVPSVLRAYYLGHLGKYLPGKAWALLLRATLIHSGGVRLGVAAFTSLYEVLTTMASGVLLAAVLFAALLPDTASAHDWPILRRLFTTNGPEDITPDRKGLILMALTLLAVVGVPLVPALFNRIVRRLASIRLTAREPDSAELSPLPHLRLLSLAEGLLLTSCGWLCLGASLWAVLQAVLPESHPLSADAWGRYTAFLALAYVAGFIILLVPSGLGIREFFLTLFLVPELGGLLHLQAAEARPTALLAVLLLRVVWTAAEMVMAVTVYWLPGPGLKSIENEVSKIREAGGETS